MFVNIMRGDVLPTETGKLDYLTDGQSPNGGRRMSTSSVGSRTGDRDSLLPGQESCSSLLGGVPDDDALSSSTHEVRYCHGSERTGKA